MLFRVVLTEKGWDGEIAPHPSPVTNEDPLWFKMICETMHVKIGEVVSSVFHAVIVRDHDGATVLEGYRDRDLTTWHWFDTMSPAERDLALAVQP